ncbi:MAG: beta-glucuronidase [Lachnospiraceae bacterium]|nr:beta-glucuronidase [Lachnospiraceae bacterium]
MYPQENGSRGIIWLDGIWNFKADDGSAEEAHWEREFPRECEGLYVPASYNDQREEKRYRFDRMKVYYHRDVVIPRVYEGQRLVLRFDAVAHNAEVYLNGELLCSHRGGFLPFEAEITDLVRVGEPFELTVVADNRIDHSTLPVGNEEGSAFFGSDNAQVPAVREAKKWRGELNLPNFDFFNYCGINRHVRICSTPLHYIEDLTIVTKVTEREAAVSYEVKTGSSRIVTEDRADTSTNRAVSARSNCPDTENATGTASNDPDRRVFVTLLDREGAIVAQSEGERGELTVPEPRLWEPYPGDPYLYRMYVTYGSDEYVEEFGIRTIEVRDQKFLINGKPFYFKGFGKHEDFYIRGRGVNELLNVKDVSLLHWIGANSFRTSHYPYAEEMYQLCDREGIVIIDETPAVGIGAGAQTDPYKTMPIRDYHKEVLKTMIARDKNHPSVILWSLGNEPDTENFPESALTYWSDLYEYAHALDPQNRPVTFVCCQNDYTKDLVTRTMDVVCINRYYGWYNLSGDIEAACYAWNRELDFWEGLDKPVMVTEYGCDALPGNHGVNGEMFTEEYQEEYYRRIDRVFDQRSFFIGEHCWCFADFGTIQGVMRPDGNRKGIFTRERRPKLAAHFLKERWEAIPNFGYKE